ncbi:MAG: magnesium transporter CorA family protein [Eubacteriales bacterium SKADARSKE-1]|nr:magnesium transporter CorA family protein [Eubacteriales bacterium SKADARSKE-1]
MISYYKTIDNRVTEIESYELGCWVNCVAPDEKEVKRLTSDFGINSEFLRSALDPEESSHIDHEDDNTLIVIDIPAVQKTEKNITYYTKPFGIVITKTDLITVSLSDNTIIGEISDGVVKNIYTNLKIQFALRIILKTTAKYLQYLKQIDKINDRVEKELRRSMKNKELIQLLEVEKSLVYFSSSLKSNEVTLEKIMRGRLIKLYEEDKELLEDVLIEVKQAIEMANIQLNILSGTMDAFASIISNNLNIVMKVLASITLIISIPAVVVGFYGMNIGAHVLPLDGVWWFPMAFSGILMVIAGFILKKKDMM